MSMIHQSRSGRHSPQSSFRIDLARELESFFSRTQATIPMDERLRIDLHCHDLNSDVSDELMGRILGVRETWLPTDDLLATLRQSGVDALTITNHNNARSCWQLLDKGVDVLPAAEWTCKMPDMGTSFHVLAYGFTPVQETRLDRLRHDIYRFAEYCRAEEIPTVLAHPLHFHAPDGTPPLSMMDRLGLLFERFECVNGQRDDWQNMLVASWVEGMDEETIHGMARRSGLPYDGFCLNPSVKRMTGGSDDHFDMFAGSCGTMLHVPDLARRRARGDSPSGMALEALRTNAMAPYGFSCDEEKLSAALLDFVCQLAENMEDPGFLRVILHRGTSKDKLLAVAVANGIFELRRHKSTMELLRTIHGAFKGHSPSLKARLFTSKPFRPMVARLGAVARARRESAQALDRVLHEMLPVVFRDLLDVVVSRVQKKKWNAKTPAVLDKENLVGMKIPIHLRALFGAGSSGPSKGSDLKLGQAIDGLPFPLLSAAVVGSAVFAAHRVLNDHRPFLEKFARSLGKFEHPRRVLWMTDTMGDKNGISHALGSALEEIRRRDLPIDIVACSSTLEEGPHLRVVRPIAEFPVPFYSGQMVRIPDVVELQRLFFQGGYDRILSSTEGPMGLSALLLKEAFQVPAHFLLHTDWLEFGRRQMGMRDPASDKFRRLLRAWYKAHDGIFVLNGEQADWLRSPDIGISPEKIHPTAHWADPSFSPRATLRQDTFPGVGGADPVLLFAGRLSEEKGVLDLPKILDSVRLAHPRTRLVLCGIGPAEELLRSAVPDAVFMGWTDAEVLARCYSAADLLVLPSRFDTFGCVVLEAMACGLPVAAYDSKGPRDLVEPGISGLLGSGPEDLARQISRILSEPARLESMGLGAFERSGAYRAEEILDQLLSDMGMGVPMTEFDISGQTSDSVWAELLDIAMG
jgi:glycosyltransferase involved in cell wall biosynthesis